jgi:hypothetical protein
MEGSLFVATALLIGRIGALDVARTRSRSASPACASCCRSASPWPPPCAWAMRRAPADPPACAAPPFAGFGLGAFTQALAAGLLTFGGATIAALYTDDAAVRALAVTLMLYAAVFQLPDGIQVLSNGVLRGLKDTRVPMLVTVVAYWLVGLPLGMYFGFGQQRGAPGLWLGLIWGCRWPRPAWDCGCVHACVRRQGDPWRMPPPAPGGRIRTGFPEFSRMPSPSNPNPVWSFFVGVGKFINFANTLVFNLIMLLLLVVLLALISLGRSASTGTAWCRCRTRPRSCST